MAGSAEMEGIWPPPWCDTAGDRVIQVLLELNVRRPCPPVGTEGFQKQVPRHPLPPLVEGGRAGRETTVTHQTSDQKRLPAEFKHITKRRRRN